MLDYYENYKKLQAKADEAKAILTKLCKIWFDENQEEFFAMYGKVFPRFHSWSYDEGTGMFTITGVFMVNQQHIYRDINVGEDELRGYSYKLYSMCNVTDRK